MLIDVQFRKKNHTWTKKNTFENRLLASYSVYLCQNQQEKTICGHLSKSTSSSFLTWTICSSWFVKHYYQLYLFYHGNKPIFIIGKCQGSGLAQFQVLNDIFAFSAYTYLWFSKAKKTNLGTFTHDGPRSIQNTTYLCIVCTYILTAQIKATRLEEGIKARISLDFAPCTLSVSNFKFF